MLKIKPIKLYFSLSHFFVFITLISGISGYLYLEDQLEKTHIYIPVLVRDVSAYYPIQTKDLMQKKYSVQKLSSDTLKQSQELLGHYTLIPLEKQKPLKQQQIGPKINIAHLKDKSIIGIPGNLELTLGGNLQAGDFIDIQLLPMKQQANLISSVITFSDILVLDVKTNIVTDKSSKSMFVIVIALPLKYQQKYFTYISNSTLLISKKL